MYKINNVLVIIIAFAAILFTACEKDPIDLTIEPIEPIEIEPEEKKENALIKSGGKMSTTGFDIDCITITFPFGFELESGETITVSDSTEIELAISNEEDYVIDFAYPIEAVNQDGNEITINNIEELAEAFIECVPTEGWNDYEEAGFPAFEFDGLCAGLVYPLTLQSAEETTITVTNEQEFADALVNGFAYFDFPVNVIDLKGNTIPASDEEHLMNVLFDCEIYDERFVINPYESIFCFEFVYPVTLVDEFENVFTADDEDEFFTLTLAGKLLEFIFPITLSLEDGTTVEVNDEYDIGELIIDCFDWTYYYGYYPSYYIDCFAFDYPIQVVGEYGNLDTVLNEYEFIEIFSSGQLYDLVYPVTVILENSTIVDINNFEELRYIEIECQEGSIFENGYTICFTFDFPLQTIDTSGNINSFDNEDELVPALYSNNFLDFVYPITINLEDGTTKVINNYIEFMYEYLACE